MAKLVWDKTGERKYETGVDHGVLYLTPPKKNPTDEPALYTQAFVWNGLTTVTEQPSGAEPTALWADNIKYVNLMSAEEFGATVEAYTYPDEFGRCDGSYTLAPGVEVGQQDRETFGFSYRTRVGNDVDSHDKAYKLHIIYGCKASPSEKAYTTINDSPDAISFSWTVTTTPVGFDDESGLSDLKPTALITIDSTTVSEDQLKKLEAVLYEEQRLPLPSELVKLFPNNPPSPEPKPTTK